MSIAFAFLMPFVMLAVVFLLARIEDRHLSASPRVLAPAGPDAERSARPDAA